MCIIIVLFPPVVASQPEESALKKRIDWYNYSKSRSNSYKQGLAYQLFGKRMKDLTPEELREYNRISASRSRKKAKESAELDNNE